MTTISRLAVNAPAVKTAAIVIGLCLGTIAPCAPSDTAAAEGLSAASNRAETSANDAPNLIFLLTDQMRAQATGYAGDPNLAGKTPNMDKLAEQGVNFSNAVSTCPVCTPYRAALMTGRYPLSTGVFLNDLQLPAEEVTIAEVYKQAGYNTAYIGKWHLDGRGRTAYIPPQRRQGFDYWKVLECTHNYNNSFYYAGDSPEKKKWPGYDAIAQTEDAARYIREHAGGEQPFILFVSYGTPHNPYQTAPAKYRAMFPPESVELRPNVPGKGAEVARRELGGYYAHIAALDDCLGRLMATIDETGIAGDTILVFTSDHGDMLHSHGQYRKQRPWDESVRVPLLIRYPAEQGPAGREIATPIGTPDIMPTLLQLSGLAIPDTVEGESLASLVRGGEQPEDRAVLIESITPFGEWTRRRGGKAYRGIRTDRYTYVRTLDGPWLLYDNEKDPYQMTNLIDAADHADLRARLDRTLKELLQQRGDKFLPGSSYVEKFGHPLNAQGKVRYKPAGRK